MSYKADLSLPPEQVLLNLINYENKCGFNFSIVKFSDEGVRPTDKNGCDSTIVLQSLPDSPYRGSWRFYYNRVDLTSYLGDRCVFIDRDQFKTTEEAIELVYQTLGIRLTTKDTLDDFIPDNVNEVKLRMSPRSILYKGYIRLVLDGSLAFQIRNRILSGFSKENILGA